jgi:hypothetical protein
MLNFQNSQLYNVAFPTAYRRKKEAREVHKRSEFAQKVHGIRAKLYQKKRFKEKATMRKT